jgi:hypothetical protein
MNELFREFNERYDKLNENLEEWFLDDYDDDFSAKSDPDALKIKKAALDYFNLCAEEFYCYKKGRIDNSVWQHWQAGMIYWFNHSNGKLKKLWNREINKRHEKISYYLEDGESFFNEIEE